MTGARFVHDTLERCGWEVEVADAVKVKGLAPLACKTDRIDAWVLAELSRRDLVPAIWLPGLRGRARSASVRAGGCIWSSTAASLKQRVHAQLMTVRARLPGQRPVRRQGRGCSSGSSSRTRGAQTCSPRSA